MLFTPLLSLVVWAAMCEVDREVHKMSFGGGRYKEGERDTDRERKTESKRERMYN